MIKDPYPHALIIELSYFDAPVAAFVVHQITTITEGLLGPRGLTWSINVARKDMTVEFVRLSDLDTLRHRLTDLGWKRIVEDSEYYDSSSDDIEHEGDE